MEYKKCILWLAIFIITVTLLELIFIEKRASHLEVAKRNISESVASFGHNLRYVNSNNLTITTNGEHDKVFVILAWTEFMFGPSWGIEGKDAFTMCEYKNCIGTGDRKLYNKSDAILFHMRALSKFKVNVANALPKYRFQNQKWVMHILESPYYEEVWNYVNYNSFNNVFNVTWTYNRKSDIWTNYSQPGNIGGLFVKKKQKDIVHTAKNYAAGKSKLAVWFVSHCLTQSLRMNYVNNLRKHIHVDLYGFCGPHACDKEKKWFECLEMVEKNYKFYLAFENSLCEDYVTEKLWSAININIVPVVLGAYNYSELLPPKSYIDVKDFKSPAELAQYLKLLDANDTLYNEYLQWKEHYDIVRHPPMQCSVCEYLNKSQNITKSYEHLDLFWNEHTDCYKPQTFYKNIEKSAWKEN